MDYKAFLTTEITTRLSSASHSAGVFKRYHAGEVALIYCIQDVQWAAEYSL